LRPLSRKRPRILKVFALLSQIRWYNILLLIFGQYLTALFVFAAPGDRLEAFADGGTHMIIWASALVLSFGFLTNSFYDLEADTINRPKQTAFERLVSKSTSFRVATLLLVCGLLLSFTVSLRAFLFFSAYAAGLWLYSHKLRSIPIVSHMSAAILGMLPFFGISVYHHFLSLHTLAFGSLLGVTLFSRELLKDMMMYKGDIIVGRHTVASEYGLDRTRFALLISNSLAWVPAFFTKGLFSQEAEIGIVLILILLTISNLTTLRSTELRALRWAHLGYKLVLIIGVLTIPFL
jgi:4-hydroxybenzoate polyprenyltransferase